MTAGDLSNSLLAAFLAADARPSLVLSLVASSTRAGGVKFRLLYCNPACQQAHAALVGALKAQAHPTSSTSAELDDPRLQAFLAYLSSFPSAHAYVFDNAKWSVADVQHKFRVVTGVSQPRASAAQLPSLGDPQRSLRRAPGGYDFLLQGVDWATSPIGSWEAWPDELHFLLPQILNSPDPAALFWGKQRINIYNEPMTRLIKGLHPVAMGQPATVAYAAFWQVFEEQLLKVEQTSKAVKHEDFALKLDRTGGTMEEAFFTNTFTPLFDHSGEIVAIFDQAHEVTAHIVSRRRIDNLVHLDRSIRAASTPHEFWPLLLRTMEGIDDLSFAAVYVSPGSDSTSPAPGLLRSYSNPNTALVLEGTIGLHAGHQPFPPILDISANTPLAAAVRKRMTIARPTPVRASDLVGPMSDDIRPYLDPDVGDDSTILLCPLELTGSHDSACLVLGLHPLRPYDVTFGNFIDLLTRQIESAARSVSLLHQERRRLQKSADEANEERIRLTIELQLQMREAQEHELRFINFAQNAPIGVFIFGKDGERIFANAAWHEYFHVDPEYTGDQAWSGHIHPDDVASVGREWERLSSGESQGVFEFRIVEHPGQQDLGNIVWLRSSAYTDTDENGQLKTVTGLCIDITAQKAHERVTEERLVEAVEAKRAQENFMDMVSHEMRNPLTAMLQCAEEANEIIQRCASSGQGITGGDLDASLDALKTILYCGNHQKQIIDDVLTVSKLDSDLLTLAFQPSTSSAVADQALKMHASEIRAADIEVQVRQAEDMATDELVLIDPGRVLQVLINLLSNAVKFLRTRQVRKLEIVYGVSRNRPQPAEIRFAHPGRAQRNAIDASAWAEDDVRYVYFSVKDTGPGLTEAERNTLFGRFKQASPRTHSQYGGSGLGLFISRNLTSLHGGQIGLTSVAGHGSTFAFYVQGRAVREQGSGIPSETPAVASPAVALLARQPQLQNGGASKPSTTPADGPNDKDRSRITVLIVEDNIVNQTVLNRQLVRLGFSTRTADHGGEALALLSRSQWSPHAASLPPAERVAVSIVLCDLEMPVMDGLTCVRTVRRWQAEGALAGRVPMVAVTGNARGEQVRTALDAGFDEVVCKPYRTAGLVPVIEGLLGGGAMEG